MIFIIFIFFFNFTEIKSFSQISLKVKREERCPEKCSREKKSQKKEPQENCLLENTPRKIVLLAFVVVDITLVAHFKNFDSN